VRGEIVLPFPPASLSGHNSGSWRSRSAIVRKFRDLAKLATLDAGIPVPDEGDIAIRFTFVPPDRRSDRLNLPIRVKAYADGIAEALGVNDSRFLPSFHFAAPAKPGRVIVEFP